MAKTTVKLIEERKICGISLTPEWSDRLEAVRDLNRQASAAAMVRFMIMKMEDDLKINQGKKK